MANRSVTSENFQQDISNELVNFSRLRISALNNAAEISPLVKKVTIGPNSSVESDESEENAQSLSITEDLPDDDNLDAELKLKVMKGYESQLVKNSEHYFSKLLKKMLLKRMTIMKQCWEKQTESWDKKDQELKCRKLRMLKDLRDNDNLSVLENAKLDEQNNQYINTSTIENMNRILEEQNIAAARFASITDSHTKICINYNEITQLLQSFELPDGISQKYITALNLIIHTINTLIETCKNGLISEHEIKTAEILASNIENIKREIIEDIAHFKEERKMREEVKRKEKEESHQKEENLKMLKQKSESPKSEQPENQTRSVKPSRTKPVFYSNKNYSYYEELIKFLANYEDQYKDLLQNASLKKFRFDCQKAVNTPVNAISSVSATHMRDKYDKLLKLLQGGTVQVLDTYLNVTQHPQGLAYCTALLARKIVRQGDLLVSSNPEAAFPLAAVTVALLPQFPDFAKLLEANFIKECPYLVPMFLPQVENQSDKDFYKSRGYQYNNEGEVEKHDKFLKRMSGIFSLQCAIWITKTPRFLNTTNPQGLKCAWRWLASFLNLKVEPDICATLINDFLNVCGSECYKNYGKQFMKIIRLIQKDYLVILDKIDEGGPKTRLEEYLQRIVQTGQIPPPNGIIDTNMW